MDAVKMMGEIVKQTAYLTRDEDSIGCAKLVVFCNAVEDNPFMAGAYHGIGQPDTVLHVGVSGPGVVKKALEKHQNASFDEMAEIDHRGWYRSLPLTKPAFSNTQPAHCPCIRCKA